MTPERQAFYTAAGDLLPGHLRLSDGGQNELFIHWAEPDLLLVDVFTRGHRRDTFGLTPTTVRDLANLIESGPDTAYYSALELGLIKRATD